MLKFAFIFLASLAIAGEEPSPGGALLPGDGPSNGGDPAQFQVYDRANFALEKIKLGKMLPFDLIAVLELANKELIVEIDPAPAIMGEVKPDPRRGNKRVVFINTKLFLEEFDRRDSTLDLTQWVVHEVFQTIINSATGRAYDTDEELSRNLKFEEKEFNLWRKRKNPGYPAVTPVAKPSFKLIRGDYSQVFGRDVLLNVRVRYDANWDQFYLSNVRDRFRGVPGFNIGGGESYGPSEVALKATADENGQVAYRLAEPVEFRHLGNSCPFDYEIEIRPFANGFHLREKVAVNSTRYHATGRCELEGYQWRTHRPYYIEPASSVFAYLAWAERATSVEEAATARLFVGAFEDYPEAIDAALKAGANPKAKDWHSFTPLQLAAMIGNLDAVRRLIPVSELTYSEASYAMLIPTGIPCSTPKTRERALEILDLIVRAGGNDLKAPTISMLKNVSVYYEDNPQFFTLIRFLLAGGTGEMRAEILPSLVAFINPLPEARTLALELVKEGIPPGPAHFEALRWAIDRNPTWFEELVKAGLDPRTLKEGENLLFETSWGDNLELSKRLVSEFKLDPSQFSPKGENPLSVSYEHYATAPFQDWLIPLTDLNLRIGENGQETVLIRVGRLFFETHSKTVQYARQMEALLKKSPGGAEVNAKDLGGHTVLDFVALRLKELTNDYHRLNAQDPDFQYARSTYLWLVTHYRAKHGVELAPPPWILNGFK